MTSARQLKANRANARTSTGPRTRQGKIRSAQNARRHGLSVSVLTDPLLSKDAENLARAIAGEGADGPGILDCARRVADAQIDLQRVRAARLGLLQSYLSNPKYIPIGKLRERIRVLNRLVSMMKRMTPQEISDPSFQKFAYDVRSKQHPQGPKKFVYILADLTKELKAMDRYERRALSRRKFAIRELDALRQQTAI
jgi:hypothetical protein